MKIIFTTILQGKPWAGNTVYEQPLGGSESAVIYLAREFARRGHDVTVFSAGQPGVYEGVTYLAPNQIPWHQAGACDVWITSRWLEALEHIGPGITRVLWLHDMPQPGDYQLSVDKVVCLSYAQASAWGLVGPNGELPGHAVIEGDGVDLTLATGSEPRDKNRLLWASNPDRGLWIAARIFTERILPRWPDMELHVYGRSSVYGWPSTVERPYLPSREHSRIILHEPLPRLALVREMMKSWALFYPTHWPETYCMVALEAQAAGTPVITSPVAALTETVKGGIVSNDIVNAVSQLRNASRWKKLSEAGKKYAAEHSWTQVAIRWEQNVFGGLK